MQQCPQCQGKNYRKNGHIKGRQRYLCKDCGRQFLQSQTLTQSSQKISMILLDLENLKLDVLAENYLQSLANYPLQIKLAFANWSEKAVIKQDVELYERGYFLVHVPSGKNSADARMMTLGAAIRIHYPQVEEVFVCSSDWLLTNLSNELVSQSLKVWQVRRQNKIIEIENRKTGEVYAYALDLNQEVPQPQALMARLEDLIKQEQQSITDKIQELSQLEALLNYRKNLMQTTEEVEAGEKSSVDEMIPASAEDLENAIAQIITDLQKNSPQQNITPSLISANFKKQFGVTANQVVKTLKVGTNLTQFLEESSHLTLNDINHDSVSATVATDINQDSAIAHPWQKITTSTQLRNILSDIIVSLLKKSGEGDIPLTSVGTSFKEYYGESVSTVMKALKVKGNFVKFVQSCEEFSLKKTGKIYRITINP